MKKILLSAILVIASVVNALAAEVNVTVTMNAISTTMSMVDKATGTPVDVGSPSSKKVYNFAVEEGTYVLTGYDTDGTTVNGTIELAISASNNAFVLQTITFYAAMTP